MGQATESSSFLQMLESIQLFFKKIFIFFFFFWVSWFASWFLNVFYAFKKKQLFLFH